jgi:hypothetical protein
MRLGTKNRLVSMLRAAGYLLAVGAASLFHNHAAPGCGDCSHSQSSPHEASSDCRHGDSDNHPQPPKNPSQCPTDGSHCSVCQFLAQKPAPTAELPTAASGILVRETFAAPPARMQAGVFSAWHSRGPPTLA